MEYREQDQNPATIQAIIKLLEANEPVPHIVLIDNDLILDGHHRARAMETTGIAIPAILLTSAQYVALKASGFDDMEIAAAAHIIGETGGEIDLNQQFPSCNLLGRAYNAADVLETL